MARTGRIKMEGEAFYHVIGRIANKAFLMRNREVKEMFLKFLLKASEFSGVCVVTYIIMDNHFHLLVYVPSAAAVDDAELLRRIGVLYGRVKMENLKSRWEEIPDSVAGAEKEAYRIRMGDLSMFMKTFVQRFTQWFNGRYKHEGGLWGGRFKSVLIESGEQLRAVVNYIHNNSVRARLTRLAGEYEWSALRAARNGDAFARRGLSLVGVDWRVDPVCGECDKRLSNGKIMGSESFVKRVLNMFSASVPRSGRRRNCCFEYCGVRFTSSHGQRSAPRMAA